MLTCLTVKCNFCGVVIRSNHQSVHCASLGLYWRETENGAKIGAYVGITLSMSGVIGGYYMGIAHKHDGTLNTVPAPASAPVGEGVGDSTPSATGSTVHAASVHNFPDMNKGRL